jgi:hypothetical protein
MIAQLVAQGLVAQGLSAGAGTSGAWFWALLCTLPLALASVHAGAAEPSGASVAAQRLQKATPSKQRSELDQPFTDAARSDWSYVPRSRSGIAWRDMNAAQREASTQLLRTALTDAGVDKAHAIMALEIALRELETFGRSRDPHNYAIALFGSPEPSSSEHSSSKLEAAWGWRIEGHHLSLHFTLLGDRYVSTLPQFMGANPALVPRDFIARDVAAGDVAAGALAEAGPRKGTRVLGEEEDLARQLLAMLEPAQRSLTQKGSALFSAQPYGDIVTKSARQLTPLSPVGISLNDLSAAQQAVLLKLITAFASHLQPELLEARLARVRAGQLSTIRFGWAGSLVRGEPHYFRIAGATFLIEFDNSGGNHVHSVWRDSEADWGRDVLADHYRRAPSQGHSHQR